MISTMILIRMEPEENRVDDVSIGSGIDVLIDHHCQEEDFFSDDISFECDID